MSDDAGRERRGGAPAHGSLGPVDPTADPATDPGLRPVPVGQSLPPVTAPPATAPPVTAPPATAPPATAPPGPPTAADPAAGSAPAVRRTRTGVLWVGLILSALVLLFLLVFIVQNDEPVQISFFALQGVLPSGVALLLAAIAGVLLGAIPGSLRILQLRRAARRGPR
jgi:uncharacterized integral membrane protein